MTTPPFLFTFEEIQEAVPSGRWMNLSSSFSAGGGVTGISTDTRELTPGSCFIALTGERFDAHEFLDRAVSLGATLLCVEERKADKVPPGVPALLVESPLKAYQKLAAFHRKRFPHLKVVALTGSCGKTGTKETLRAIFSKAYGAERVLATEGNTNNQIGVPRNLLRLTERHEIAVIEMGTNHHGEIEPLSETAEPDAGLIVSIGNCHLEFLGSLEGVAQEKSKIFSHLRKDGIAVLPECSAGGEILREASSSFRQVLFGEGESADFQVRYLGGNVSGSAFELIRKETGESIRIDWLLSGRHHAVNAAGAAALASSLGIPMQTIGKGIADTVLPGMRMRRSFHHGALWINDAYNANPNSMKAAIEWLSEFADPASLVLVLGDMGEIGVSGPAAHRNVLELALSRFPKARILAVGPQMTEAFDAIRSSECTKNGICGRKAFHAFPDSGSAGKEILNWVKEGDTVFLKASRSTALEKVEPDHEDL